MITTNSELLENATAHSRNARQKGKLYSLYVNEFLHSAYPDSQISYGVSHITLVKIMGSFIDRTDLL